LLRPSFDVQWRYGAVKPPYQALNIIIAVFVPVLANIAIDLKALEILFMMKFTTPAMASEP